MKLEIRGPARQDMLRAQQWYEAVAPHVVDRFTLALEHAIRAAAREPLLYETVYRDVRCSRLRHFPHGVYFRVVNDVVVIIACIHGRRGHPFWQNRRRTA